MSENEREEKPSREFFRDFWTFCGGMLSAVKGKEARNEEILKFINKLMDEDFRLPDGYPLKNYRDFLLKYYAWIDIVESRIPDYMFEEGSYNILEMTKIAEEFLNEKRK